MLMALQQLSGINVIMFYSTDIFNQAGLGASLAQFGSILIAITQVQYAWPSRTYADVMYSCSNLFLRYLYCTIKTSQAPLLYYYAATPMAAMLYSLRVYIKRRLDTL